jgi:hypothetical protein
MTPMTANSLAQGAGQRAAAGNPFHDRLSRSSSWWNNYVSQLDDNRTRLMYSEICAMLIICMVVTGFIVRLAELAGL